MQFSINQWNDKQKTSFYFEQTLDDKMFQSKVKNYYRISTFFFFERFGKHLSMDSEIYADIVKRIK